MSEDDFTTNIGINKRIRNKQNKQIRDEYSSDLDSDSNQEPEDDDKKAGSDSDMFESDDDNNNNNSGPKPSKKKKEKKRLDMSQFERENELFDKPDDFDSESKIAIESFDLKKEEEEGYFDEDGNFIRNKSDDSQDEDQWGNVDIEEIARAKKAQLAAQRRNEQSTVQVEPVGQLLYKIIEELEPDENPLEAMTRMAPKVHSKRRMKRKHSIGTDPALDSKNRALITKITDICDKLMLYHDTPDIYELTREQLMRKYTSKTGEPFEVHRGVKRPLEDEDENSVSQDNGHDGQESRDDDTSSKFYSDKIWQFKWEDLDDIEGPFTAYEMNYWKDSYFENKVYVKRTHQSEFTHISNASFD